MRLRIAGALLLSVVAFFFMAQQRNANSEAPTTASEVLASPRPSVAVLGFKNLTGRRDASWLSTALSEMLSTELATGGRLRVVPGELVSRMNVDLLLAEAQSYAPDTLLRIRQELNTNYVILGSYVAIGEKGTERIRVDLRIQEIESGETIASLSDSGSAAELFELVAGAGAVLRERMGVEACPKKSEPHRPRRGIR